MRTALMAVTGATLLVLSDNTSDPFLALVSVLTGIVLWLGAAAITGYQVYQGILWLARVIDDHRADAARKGGELPH
jgi:hypothetical protein